jgi:septum formation protein
MPDGTLACALSETIVRFKRLSPAEIDAYIAGANGTARPVAMPSRAAPKALRLARGSHSGVIGLPLFETRRLLVAAGLLA